MKKRRHGIPWFLRCISLVCVVGLGLMTIVATGGCGGGGGEGATTDDSTIPRYTLSGEQEKLVNDYGNPDYLTMTFDPSTGQRKETWSYPEELEKMYVFWDGDKVSEENASVDPDRYYNPSFIDPTLFTADTQETYVLTQFGDDYTEHDHSEDNFVFKTLYYSDLGLCVSFFGEKLSTVQTLDVPQ